MHSKYLQSAIYSISANPLEFPLTCQRTFSESKIAASPAAGQNVTTSLKITAKCAASKMLPVA